uniref:Uncharacterized protein n=1 Tax=Leptocylindrus danicus TaxID=163516 RepID=A0A7S2JVD4_9STRA
MILLRLTRITPKYRAAAATTQCRSFGMKRKEHFIPKDPSLLPAPGQIKPPSYFTSPPEPVSDPDAYVRKPVTAAHSIDLTMDTSGKLDASYHPAMIGSLSKEDVCTIDANGEGVVHGRYGKLTSEQVAGIPLEYLSILNMAAEGAAAIRTIAGTSTNSEKGTIVVYGATHPSALAAVQLASAQGLTSVAVVGGDHSGNAEAVDLVKGFAAHPGTAVPEEYAIRKSVLGNLVKVVSEGEQEASVNSEQFVSDFRANLKDYCATFEEEVRGLQLSDAELDTFSADDYAVLKHKFKLRGNSLLGGDLSGPPFEPPMLVRDAIRGGGAAKESLEDYPVLKQENEYGDAFIPFDLSVLETKDMPGLDDIIGGPVKGAIIAATPTLLVACEVVSKAKGKRAKAEALQYLTGRQRNAYAAASSVAAAAKAAGADVYVVGGALPEMKSVDVTSEDVSAALDVMRVDEDGSSKLNFLVQVFRAGDYQSYQDYAIHKATEPLSGPRVKVVTK